MYPEKLCALASSQDDVLLQILDVSQWRMLLLSNYPCQSLNPHFALSAEQDGLLCRWASWCALMLAAFLAPLHSLKYEYLGRLSGCRGESHRLGYSFCFLFSGNAIWSHRYLLYGREMHCPVVLQIQHRGYEAIPG